MTITRILARLKKRRMPHLQDKVSSTSLVGSAAVPGLKVDDMFIFH